jgi:hypothetical protein
MSGGFAFAKRLFRMAAMLDRTTYSLGAQPRRPATQWSVLQVRQVSIGRHGADALR